MVCLAIDRMPKELDSRGAIDMLKWTMFTATDVIGELTFGDLYHMLVSGDVSSCWQ